VSEHKLPTRAEALDFLAKAGCSQGVIEHCKAVSKYAAKIARAYMKKGFNVDIQLVEVSALLHDIGRSKTHTVDHGIIGGEIAVSLGLPNSVVQIIQRHVGGGIPIEEAKQLGWPPKDYLPRTLEEKIVCYADKRVEGLRTVSIEKALKTYAANLGENHPALDRIKKLHEEIVAIVGDPQ
jgi:uncharacterized protein